jgi:multidrug resistance protein MdtO
MAQANEIHPQGSPDVLTATPPPDLFSEVWEYCYFLWEELKPFPGREHAVIRLTTSVVITVILSQVLRIPYPFISAYLVFYGANEDGVASIRLGFVSMAVTTATLVAAMGVTICFMDAPWFRLPATFLLMGSAIWLTRALTQPILGRLMGIILALYLSIADVIYDPEILTENILWLWSVVGVSGVVAVVTSLVLEPRPDLLLRAQLESSLEAVECLLEAAGADRLDRVRRAKAARRQLYASPMRMRQLLARWQQRKWPVQPYPVNWELAIFIVERLLSSSAALAASSTTDESIRRTMTQLGQSVRQLKEAVHDRNPGAIRVLRIPETRDLTDSLEKAGIVEVVAALSDAWLVLEPDVESREEASANNATPAKPGFFVTDALTNSDYSNFALRTVLAIAACDIFMNAVAWPGIFTSLITCVVTALATVGAQRQKFLLRITGAFGGGLMGLVAVIWLVPHLDSIVGLSLIIAVGTACSAWVSAGSVRSSYAGFQMALAFYLVLLPGFVTSVDLTGIRDRFVGILVGITAMWICVDQFWQTSSRRQLLDTLIGALRLMAKGSTLISPAMHPAEARKKAISFRRELYGILSAGRLFCDETKIEQTLALDRKPFRGSQLEALANEVTFAAFLMLALNEKKLRGIGSGRLASIQSSLRSADDFISKNLERLANRFHRLGVAALDGEVIEHPEADLPQENPHLSPLGQDSIGFELRSIYQALQESVARIYGLTWIVRALP